MKDTHLTKTIDYAILMVESLGETTMKVYAIKCPHCGAPLEYADNATVITCEYCGGKVEIERETLPERNLVQEGKDFERGRVIAQNEMAKEEARREKRKKRMFWVVLAWACLPWLMGTILFCRKCRWKWYWKLLLLIAAYAILILLLI